MSVTSFDDLTDVYEAMIDWPKRLANEGPFYRRLFERLAVRSVVDVACGTGRHAAMFHAWGLRVEGSDLSANMVARARSSFGEPSGLCWTVRGFDQPIAPAEPFDAAVCVGNSLALAPDTASVERAIQEMFSAVRPGGAIIIHALNLWRLPDGPCVWQKCRWTTLVGEEAEMATIAVRTDARRGSGKAAEPVLDSLSTRRQDRVLIVKGVHRCGGKGYVELIVAAPDGGTQIQSDSVAFLGLDAAELERIARRAGAGQVRFFGGYKEEPYDRDRSIDLVMVAEKE
jgi:SAM-dependent methyltransferase